MPPRSAALALALLLSLASSARAEPRVPRPPPARYALRAPALPAALTMRRHFLQLAFEELGARDRERVLSGSLQLAIGATSGTLAVFADDPAGRSVFALTALLAVARGSAQLGVSMDARRTAAEFARLPEDDEARLREKLRRGEAALARAAQLARRARRIEGSLSIFGAAVFVPVYVGLSRRDDPGYQFGEQAFDYVSLSLSVIGFAAGLVQSIVASDAERRLRAYRALPGAATPAL